MGLFDDIIPYMKDVGIILGGTAVAYIGSMLPKPYNAVVGATGVGIIGYGVYDIYKTYEKQKKYTQNPPKQATPTDYPELTIVITHYHFSITATSYPNYEVVIEAEIYNPYSVPLLVYAGSITETELKDEQYLIACQDPSWSPNSIQRLAGYIRNPEYIEIPAESRRKVKWGFWITPDMDVYYKIESGRVTKAWAWIYNEFPGYTPEGCPKLVISADNWWNKYETTVG